MARGAQKGNQLWKFRSKHGRNKLFETPDLLWEAATEYFNHVDANPWYNVEAIKSGDKAGQLIKVPTARPYSLEGFSAYIGASPEYWREFKKAGHVDFSDVIDRIDNVMFMQKFEGAAVGAFNGNIISRYLGLSDRTDITTKGQPVAQQLRLDLLTDDELRTILDIQERATPSIPE